MRWKPMMVLSCAAVLLLSGQGLPHAFGQRPAAGPSLRVRLPGRRPVTSPYLNLLAGNGRSFAFNYFRRVQPEVEFRQADALTSRSLQNLRREVRQVRRRDEQLLRLGPTGHGAAFMDLSSYFPVLNRMVAP